MRVNSLSFILILISSFVLKANDTLQRSLIQSIDWKLLTINSVTSVSALTLREWRSLPTVTSMNRRQDRFIIPKWDLHSKGVNQQWDLYSDIGAYGSFVLPVGLLIGDWIDHSPYTRSSVLQYIGTTWMTMSAVLLLKYSIYRPRPFTYGVANGDYVFRKRDSASFVSGHTAMTSSNCFFFYLQMKDKIDNPWKRKVLLGVSLSIPAFVGYSRMKAGQHFMTDVLAGYFVGLSSAYLIHNLQGRRGLHLVATPNGIGVNLSL